MTESAQDTALRDAASIADGLENVLTGQGSQADSRHQGARKFKYARSTPQELQDAYRDNWLVGQVVDIPAFEMTRAQRILEIDDDQDLIDLIEAKEEALQIWQKVREAIQWSDLFGGGALLLGVDGHGDLKQPLDVTKIQEGQLRWVRSFDSRSLFPFGGKDIQLSYDPTSDTFLEPEVYTLAGGGVEQVHHSRIVKFHGLSLPWFEMVRTLWWGGSRVERMFSALLDAEQVIGGVAELVTESKVDVIGVKDLMQLLGTPDGETVVQKRMTLVNQSKSLYNAVVMDSEEAYNQKTNMIAQGMPALVEQFLAIVAAASGIPVTRLLGTSATGLNATGEGDLTNYYDMIESRRKNYLKPRIDALDQVFLRSCGVEDPDSIPWAFGNLWQMTDAEQATVEKTRAETDTIHINNGTIDEVIAAKRLAEAGTYSALDATAITDLEAELEELENEPDVDPLAGPQPVPAPGDPRAA